MSTLIKNCGQLLTMASETAKRGDDMSDLGMIADAYLLVENGRIAAFGEMKDCPDGVEEVIDAEGRVVMPGMIDCHTHLVFGGNRAHEFEEKMAGKSYLDILADGGGILSTVRMTREASEEELYQKALRDLEVYRAYGVTTVETKTGYGLDLDSEMKLLKVAARLQERQNVGIVSTFLGAHVVGPDFEDADVYLQYLLQKVLPEVRDMAEFVDIFCEKGAFTVEQARSYLAAANEMGFKLKVHSEQINDIGGTKMACELGAVSADHLDQLSAADMAVLAKSETVGVVLPLVPFYTREKKYADGRAMIDAGCAVALATDYNPGSAPSKNIYLAMNFACLEMGMRVEEVLNAVTINAAHAIDRAGEIGSIAVGKKADIVMMDVSDYREIPYWLGESLSWKVMIGGQC